MKEITTVGTIIEHDGRILTLLRSEKEHSPNTWGLAAGRLGTGEDPLQAAIREIREETGYAAKEEELEPLGVETWHQPEFIVHFHTYRMRLQRPIPITLDKEEHQAYDWKTPQQILGLDNAIAGLKELMEKHYGKP